MLNISSFSFVVNSEYLAWVREIIDGCDFDEYCSVPRCVFRDELAGLKVHKSR